MRALIGSIEQEYRRYKTLGEGALSQLADAELAGRGGEASNSVATIVWHISGNLASRFTDFLTSDGEKPWREREEEFAPRDSGRDAVVQKWDAGWAVLLDTLADLTDADLDRMVSIRGRPLPVHEALHRSLAHVAYHVGQIVYVAKSLRDTEWSYLTIPPGGTAAYDRRPFMETGSPEPADDRG